MTPLVTRRRVRREQATRTWLAGLVRSGLAAPEAVHGQAVEVIGHDLPWLARSRDDAVALAAAWIAEVRAEWARDALTWPEQTDYDRLQVAFGQLHARGLLVLQGCADHWSARSALDKAPTGVRGVLWFLPADVWHAIDAGMLEVNLWHPDGANAAPGDDLLDEVLDVFAADGLEAHFDEGRIEVAAYWHRRP